MSRNRRIMRLGSARHRWRDALLRLQKSLHGSAWFPQIPLALLLGWGALALLRADLGPHWRDSLQLLASGRFSIEPEALPLLAIGLGLLTMAIGLALRSRLVWAMALLLAIATIANLLLGTRHSHVLLFYFVALLTALLVAWRQFSRSSIAASTLFALTSIVMLLMYATFGSYYLGADFRPPITDLVTALYYAVVTMTTVGYGDIVPGTAEARLFAISVIVFGVAAFATSLTAVVAPLVRRSLQRIVNRKGSGMKRENHFVVVGNTALAVNTSRELARRGREVTRVLREVTPDVDKSNGDVVGGDPSNIDVLARSGCPQGQCGAGDARR